MPTGYKVALALGLVAVLGILGYIAFDTESTPENPSDTNVERQPMAPAINDGQPGMMTSTDMVTDQGMQANRFHDQQGNQANPDQHVEFGPGYRPDPPSQFVDGGGSGFGHDQGPRSDQGGNVLVDDQRADDESHTIHLSPVSPVQPVTPVIQPDSPTTPVVHNNDNNVTEGTVYIIKEDDRLWDISKAHYGTGTNWEAIVKANPGLNPQRLRSGTKIILPDLQSSNIRRVAHTDSRPDTNVPAGTKLVKVKDGETLSDIALREYGRSADYHLIIKANPGVNPMRLYIGQTLRIPKKTQATTARVNHPTPRHGFRYYTVGKNETYYDIADSLYGDYTKHRLIAEANPNIDPRKLRVGMKILVPDM